MPRGSSLEKGYYKKILNDFKENIEKRVQELIQGQSIDINNLMNLIETLDLNASVILINSIKNNKIENLLNNLDNVSKLFNINSSKAIIFMINYNKLYNSIDINNISEKDKQNIIRLLNLKEKPYNEITNLNELELFFNQDIVEISVNGDREFKPHISDKKFDAELAARSLIKIDYNGNHFIKMGLHHPYLVEASYKLVGPGEYFKTLEFEATKGNLTVINEESGFMVYLPQELTFLQYEKLKEILDYYGINDLNADFSIARVQIKNSENTLYNGKEIPAIFYCTKDENYYFNYSDFLKIASENIISDVNEYNSAHRR